MQILKFRRTEEITIPLPIEGPFHRRDAEAFANDAAGDLTRLEAQAIAKNSGAQISQSPWTLAADEGIAAIANPFALIPQPPKPRGRRPGSTSGASIGGDDGPGTPQADDPQP